MFDLVAWLLIELSGSNSFRVRETSTLCLSQIHKRGWIHQDVFDFALAHRDPEIRARAWSLVGDQEERWTFVWFDAGTKEEYARKVLEIEESRHLRFRYLVVDYDPASFVNRHYVGLFERR